jgi:hypothetical protein
VRYQNDYRQVTRKVVTQNHKTWRADRTWAELIGMVNSKTVLLQTIIFSSQKENAIMRIFVIEGKCENEDSPLQDSCWWKQDVRNNFFFQGPRKRSIISGRSDCLVHRKDLLSFMMHIKGFYYLLKKNPSNLPVLTVRVEVDLSSHFPLPVCRSP